MRHPCRANTRTVVRFPPRGDLPCLEVPDEAFAISVAGHQVRHLRREIDVARIASGHVAAEGFLCHALEIAQHVEHDDFVVHRLADKPLA